MVGESDMCSSHTNDAHIRTSQGMLKMCSRKDIPYPDPIGNSTKYWKLLMTLNYSFVSVLIILVGVNFLGFLLVSLNTQILVRGVESFQT